MARRLAWVAIVMAVLGLVFAALLALTSTSTRGRLGASVSCGSLFAAEYPRVFDVGGKCDDARAERRSTALVVAIPAAAVLAIGVFVVARKDDRQAEPAIEPMS